jgi:hypothetical protein
MTQILNFPTAQPEGVDKAAREQPTGYSLDGLADATLERIAEFFGKCVNEPGFCGFSVDEMTDEDGRMLSFTLVPCDEVNGDPVRRVAKPRH